MDARKIVFAIASFAALVVFGATVYSGPMPGSDNDLVLLQQIASLQQEASKLRMELVVCKDEKKKLAEQLAQCRRLGEKSDKGKPFVDDVETAGKVKKGKPSDNKDVD